MNFKLDDKNKILKEQYEKGIHYKVKEINNGNKCFIFFSSNGIYYPNDIVEFQNTIIRNDRYEWIHVADMEEIRKDAARIIFVRDIYKQYYVKGINSKIDTLEKLVVLLRELTKGFKVVTVGVSSGGFAAIVVGVKLKAEKIYSFGGQWSLWHEVNKGNDESSYFLQTYKDNSVYNKYYDITHLLNGSESSIYYFYSALNESDMLQATILKNTDEKIVRKFAMKSRYHGYLMFNKCYAKVINAEVDKLDKLAEIYRGGNIFH